MSKKDILLALLVIVVWGANFTVISLGLGGVPPMLLVAIRYTLVAFPAIFFVKKPQTQWKYIIYYGMTVGVGQFACLFYAMHIGMPASLASIITQIQAFITPVLASFFLKEELKSKQVIGIVIAVAGLFIIGWETTSSSGASIPLMALGLTIGAPVFWSASNIISKVASNKAREEGHELKMLNMVIWSSLVPPIPMVGLALLIDPPAVLLDSLSSLGFLSIFSALYLAYAATIFGYGFWNILLSKYPMSKISPLSLLVPITGLFTARIVLGEQLSSLQWLGVCIILLGLMISNLNFKPGANSSLALDKKK